MDYKQLLTAIDAASQALLGRAAKAVNHALVVRNWLIGAHLLECEQSGQDRATYDEQLLSNLAADLKARGLKGLGISMLKNCRQFYWLYPDLRQSLAGELGTIPVRPEIGQSTIGEFDPGLPALPREQWKKTAHYFNSKSFRTLPALVLQRSLKSERSQK